MSAIPNHIPDDRVLGNPSGYKGGGKKTTTGGRTWHRSFRCFFPGESQEKPSARLEMNIPEVVANLPPVPEGLEDPFLQVELAFSFNPLTIKGEGAIKVRARREDQDFRVGQLAVRMHPQTAALIAQKEAAN